MTWEKDFTEAISSAALHAGNMPDNKQIISLIDLTLLNNNASLDELHALAAKAERYSVAAVCVLPKHLDDIPQEWQIKRATVINFPGGNQNRHDALLAVEAIIKSRKADEIDYVFPYSAYLNGEHDYALSCCHEQFKLCQANNVIFKVILETGAFPDMERIHQASLDIIGSGCDFLKTSTGKIPEGASLEAAFAMLQAIKSRNASCGIKISGGIKTKAQALQYIQLAQFMLGRQAEQSWFRIGSSSLLDDLL